MSGEAKRLHRAAPPGAPAELPLALRAGRRLTVRSTAREDLLEISEAQGRLLLTLRLTDDGLAISATGAHLELRASESLSLASKRVTINATEDAVLESGGRLRVGSAEQMEIRSVADVRVVGKVIHLN